MVPGRKKNPLSFIPAIALLFPLLYLIGNLLAIGVPDLANGGDGALLEMSTRDVFSRRILLGPYSRFLFFHPGPLYFIVRYPIYMLLSQRSSAFLVSTILIAAGSLLGIWQVLRKQTGESAGAIAAVVFGLFLAVMDKTFWLSEWNPHVIMFPVLFFVVSSAVFATGDSRYFIGCAASGSFVAQTHLGGIPLLVVVFAASLAFLIYPWLIRKSTHNNSSFKWKHIVSGSILLLVLWAPPLYEQFSSDKGNMTRIQEYFEDNVPEITVIHGLHHWSRTVTRFELERFMPALRRSGNHDDVSLIVVALRILLLSVSYGLLRRKGCNAFLCALSLLLVVAHAIAFYSVTRIRGPVNAYLIEWMIAIAPLSYIAILASCVVVTASHLPTRIRRMLPYATAVTAILLSVYTTNGVSGYLRKEIDPSSTDLRAIEEISLSLGHLMSEDPDTYYVLNLQTWDCWIVMTGLMNRLEKQGYNIVMSRNVWFKDTPVPDGYPSRTLQIGYLSEHWSTPSNLVARYDRICVLLE